MFGLLNVNKPGGMTSHDVVATIRRHLPRKTKVGHAGTLDPFADGVLVVCVGPATRLADYVQARPKRYLATVRLGAVSATDDTEGPIQPVDGAADPGEPAVREALADQVGVIQQVPPAHSAVHVDGRRAYQRARAGESLDLPAREVTVRSIDLVEYGWPDGRIEICCGSGTYIRSVARDVGAALGVGGYCAALTRTAVGSLTLAGAVDLDRLDPERDLLPPRLAVQHLPAVRLNEGQLARVRMGQFLNADELPAPDATGVDTTAPDGADFDVTGLDVARSDGIEAGQELALLDESGQLVGLGRATPTGRVRPAKVFQLPSPS